MLTQDQKRQVCLLHICVTFEALYQLSPASRFNMNLPVSNDAVFPLQMIQVHFQNMADKEFTSMQECENIYMPMHSAALKDKKYRDSTYLQDTIIQCISSLLGDKPSTESKLWSFISGYSMYIPNGHLKHAIGEWLHSKDKMLGILWSMW